MKHVNVNLQDNLDRLEKAIENKKTNDPQSAEIFQLPLWSEPERGTPNQVLRGALFGAIKGSNRKALQRELIITQKNFEIRFTGVQLGQNDLDAFEQALHLARLQPLGAKCSFTATAFLKALGRKTGKTQHEQLKMEFSRLMGCGLEITDQEAQITYGGSLLEYWRDEHTGRYIVQFNPKMRKLFDKGWTSISLDERKKLKSKPLAQWLHAFISTHAKVHPMKIETYRDLSGSKTKELKRFKQALKTALEALKKIGFINTFHFEDGLVYIDRTPSPSQQKYLSKK